MFDFASSPDYPFPVKAKVRGADGVLTEHTFHLTFKRYNQAQHEELLARMNSGALPQDAFLREVVVGFGNDANGQRVPFDAAEFDRLLLVRNMKMFITDAFFDAQSTEMTEIARSGN